MAAHVLAAALSFAAVGCGGEITRPVQRGVIRFVPPDTGTADGASLTLIEAEIDPNLAPDKRRVTFTTTAGSFGGQPSVTVPADTAGVARAYLTAPADSAVALVSATADNVTRTAQILFRRPAPASVEVTTASFALDTGFARSVEVTAVVRSARLAPVPNAIVQFEAKTESGGTIGQFSTTETVTNATGTARTNFTAGRTDYRGPVRIIATARDREGRAVSDTVTIQVR